MTEELDLLEEGGGVVDLDADVDRYLPDGIYLDLDPTTYFNQAEALGGTDLIKLYQRRGGWWWASVHNRRRRDRTTSAQNYGSALHAIMLEGEAVYEARFLIRPDQADYGPELLTSEPSIRAAFKAGKIDLPAGTSKWTKADWNEAALVYFPDRPVWDVILETFNATLRGRQTVTSTEDELLRLMRDAAFGQGMFDSTPESEEIRVLLSHNADFPVLPEVSILYTRPDGIRRRARIDLCLPRFDLDLKSLGNWKGREPKYLVPDIIPRSGYDIQRADYHAARRQMYRMLAERGVNAIHGGTNEQRQWLASYPSRFPEWEWVWLFYQKPDFTQGTEPVLFPLWDDIRSDYHLAGARKALKALAFYRGQVEKFGLEKPWCRVEPCHYTNSELTPNIPMTFDALRGVEQPEQGEEDYLGTAV